MTLVEMCVHMDCPGCEKKIRKAVQRLEGVHDVEIDMAQQKVTVNGDVEQKKVLKALRRTGRRAVLWPLPYAAGAGAGAAHVLAEQQLLYQPGAAGLAAHASHAARPTSSYNYYKHGYDDSRMYGAYYHHGANSAVAGTRATDYFSDENAQGCSVM
ncbi:heavy metal-associated isoprenylated plant protein 28-like [Miscanthus floridulus]|uniref:heavy metal-associated isoprenylated plant protein 28-like n=1 Tax=Miscanthus floridulus TaxID=154761 RepID=UPI003457E6C3